MCEFRVLTSSDESQWLQVLSRVKTHDFQHLPGYHRLSQERRDSEAHLFVYSEGNYLIAMPMLTREVDLPGFGEPRETKRDATSVYGYAGPLSNAKDIPIPVVENFQRRLAQELKDRGVVSVFSRLHPLIPQSHLLAGLGKLVERGQTVSIDLTLPAEEQFARYRKDHRKDVRKLRRLGVRFAPDPDFAHLNDFCQAYRETMDRVGAPSAYRYDETFFERLTRSLKNHVHAFLCWREEAIVCAGLFASCNGIVQSFLTGSLDRHHGLAATKLLIDGARLWAIERGAEVFHLGGGVGSRRDSLFSFKAGFSDRRHDFATWECVLLPEEYKGLCRQREKDERLSRVRPASPDYFPRYRSPVVPLDATAGQRTTTLA